MLRLIIILGLWLAVGNAVGQSDDSEPNRAVFDTICSIHERMKDSEVLLGDSSLQAQLSALIGPAKEWVHKHGSERDQAQCALIHWRHLAWSKSPDTYTRIIVAKEIRNLRSHIPRGDLLQVLGQLSAFYQRTKRPTDRLDVMLEICSISSETDFNYYCGQLAGVYHDLKQYDRAIEQYHQDVLYEISRGNWFGVSSLHNNIGLAYRDMGIRDSAEHYFTNALGILSDQKLVAEVDTFYLGHFTSVVNWNLQNFLEEEITTEKLRLAYSLIRTGSKVPEYIWVLKAYDLLARHNYQERDLGSAELYADSALTLANETKHMDMLVSLLRLKGKVLLAEGKLEQADDLFEQSNQVADSVRLAEAALDASIAAAQFEAKEREQELKASQELVKLAELEAESEHRQRQWFTALFIGSLLILTLVIVLLRLSSRNRKIIAAQNEQLEASLSEREVLLKEIHHRVKNNLQVISSLLDLQSNRMSDEASQSAFLEGQSRVKSIALIHQQLYQNEELTGVEFVTFTEALFKQVRSAMMEKGQKVELLLKAEPTSFDIDTAVPLGLILNEMLTNSFKHAFKVNETSSITIELHGLGPGKYELRYTDGGPGLSTDIELKKVRSLGLRLIYRLTRQLGGTVETNTSDGKLFVIQFLNTEARKEHN